MDLITISTLVVFTFTSAVFYILSYRRGYHQVRTPVDVDFSGQSILETSSKELDCDLLRHELPYVHRVLPSRESLLQAKVFYETMRMRRSVRCISDKIFPFETIQCIIKTAVTAPSGYNLQPWTFAVVRDSDTKDRVRYIIEDDYRIRHENKDILRKLGSTECKEYLSTAPYLIIVFKQKYGIDESTGNRIEYGYVDESVGIACGVMISAIQMAGLTTVPTTVKSRKQELSKLLKRPQSEEVWLIFPVGYPCDDATVPDIDKKPLSQIIAVY